MIEKKPIPGLDWCTISADGTVTNEVTGRELKQLTLRHGYKYVQICSNGKNIHKTVHRLLAEAFIPNPENKPCVNHIDGNKQNNALSNLEWCTKAENTEHAAKVLKKLPQYEKCNEERKKRVQGTKISDGEKTVFESIRSAARITGIANSNIRAALSGKQKTAGKYIWEYA